jgi:hypothetical protein
MKTSNAQADRKTFAGSGSPSTTKPQQSAVGIRMIDFGNFTYPWYPEFVRDPSAKRELVLTHNEFEVPLNNEAGLISFRVNLEHVLYADVTGDGQDDAIVYLAGSVAPNGFFGNLMVYTYKNDRPVLLYQVETGDRGNGGLRGFRSQNGQLIIEIYDPAVNEEQSLCCPKKYRRMYLSERNGQFSVYKSEVLNNEYANAYFVGYPNDN